MTDKNRTLTTRVAGVTYENRQEVIKQLNKSSDSWILKLVREPDNPYGSTAIAVYWEDQQIGYVNKKLSPQLATIMDAGHDVAAEIVSISPGDNKYSWGVEMKVYYYGERISKAGSKKRAATKRYDDIDLEDESSSPTGCLSGLAPLVIVALICFNLF